MKIKIATKRYLNLSTELDRIPASAETRRATWREQMAEEHARIDTDKLGALFDGVNGRANRHVVEAYQLRGLVQDAEARLAEAGIAKKNQSGSTLTYVPAAPSASAYKYSVISTQVELTRGSSGDWFLTGIHRVDLYPRTPEVSVLTISEAAQAELVRHAMTGFAVAPAVAQAA